MQAQRHRDRVDRQHVLHQRFERDARAVRAAPHEFHEVVRIGAVEAAADADPRDVQRAAIDAAADDPFERLERMHAGELEMRLDAGRLQPAQVFVDPAGAGRYRHLAVRLPQRGFVQRRAGDVLAAHQLGDVHLHGVDRDRHLVGLRRQLGEHVAGVVGQPFRVGALAFRRERDRAADLQDHVRHGLAQPAEQLVEFRQPLAALAVEFAHMHVQHRRARVVAVDGLLHVLVHRHRNVFRKIGGHPFGAVRRDRDDNLVLVFRVQRIVEKLHVVLQWKSLCSGVRACGSRRAGRRTRRVVSVVDRLRCARAQNGTSPTMPARSIRRTHGG
ncbi:hypothetical protein BamIOP4010DRAFT_6597 [Burkholderia ambifaria IOP40-10]|uniref:Uncharacterized protein n=1 Tax=Burkholderia ambifaria IOP40-10 TaxID=396596 RepID=B1FRD6_9BURK|nr:hypothetical protein BamIOP4010DRAFT_6597 [Burkholderia ambifaria IOP40-10]